MSPPRHGGRTLTAALLTVLLAPSAPAQTRDRAEPLPPASGPRDQARRQTLDACALYGLAVLEQRQDRLVEAARLLEEASRLDPAAAAPRKLLVPLLHALGRTDDAIRAAQEVVRRDPDAAATWQTLAAYLEERRRLPEAVAALTRCLACPILTDHPDRRLTVARELARLHEAAGTPTAAVGPYQLALRVFDAERAALLETGRWTAGELDREEAATAEALGRACVAAGKPAEAEAAFGRARRGFEKANDAAGVARGDRNLASVCAARQDFAAARRHLEHYLAGKPHDPEAYELLARVWRPAGPMEAANKLNHYAAKEPGWPPLQLLLAAEWQRAGDRDRAEHVYRAVLAKEASAEAYRGLFRLFAETDRHDRILALIDQKLKAGEDKSDDTPEADAAARHARAVLAALRGETALARALIQQAAHELQTRGDRPFAAWRLLAQLAERVHELDYAERLLRPCLLRAPPDREPEVYGNLLNVLWAARKRPEVVALCRQGLERAQSTDKTLFYFNLARAQAQLGRVDEALAAAAEGVKLAGDRNRVNLRLLRAWVLAWAERFAEAEAECRALLAEKLPPEDERAVRLRLSEVYAAARQHAKAEEQLRLVIELDPGDARAHNDLGYQLADEGRRLDEAEQLVRRALELDCARRPADDDEENAAYLDSLGWVLFRRGRVAEAREWLRKSAALPDGAGDPTVWDHLGDVEYRLGAAGRAAEAWRKASGLYVTEKRTRSDPRADEVRRKLEKLIPPSR